MVLRRWVLAGAALMMLNEGCTFDPTQVEKPQSRAAPPAGALSEAVEARVAALPQGFDTALIPLVDGNEALGARLRAIEAAENTIDLKTFLIKPDLAGSLIAVALFEAAERGVAVRLLYDDVFTTARDDQIAKLDSHPNIELRSFNPMSRNAPVVMNFLLDFGRVNRRMHNKAMIVDGALAIVGGRNLADEYYQINTSHEFADFDLLLAGPPVAELARAFDLYWNDPYAVPLAAFETTDPADLRAAVAAFRANANSEEADIYDRAVSSRRLDEALRGLLPPLPGRAEVVVDDPEKLRRRPGAGPYDVAEALYRTISAAEREVLVITPYFVPRDYGADIFEALVARGVRVRVVTNSLASTNHAYVHGGYRPYRERLMAVGVEFYEVREDAPRLTGGHDTPLTMHSKLVVVDDDRVFVSSTNVDPRSIRQNSEIGVVITSPALAGGILRNVAPVFADYTFALSRGPDGETVWDYRGATGPERFTREPGASLLARIVARVTQWLPVESQL